MIVRKEGIERFERGKFNAANWPWYILAALSYARAGLVWSVKQPRVFVTPLPVIFATQRLSRLYRLTPLYFEEPVLFTQTDRRSV